MRQALGPGALGRPRGIGWRGRWEGGSGWGIHVTPWLIHVNVWQKPLQYCKVISLQLIKINGKNVLRILRCLQQGIKQKHRYCVTAQVTYHEGGPVYKYRLVECFTSCQVWGLKLHPTWWISTLELIWYFPASYSDQIFSRRRDGFSDWETQVPINSPSKCVCSGVQGKVCDCICYWISLWCTPGLWVVQNCICPKQIQFLSHWG